MAYKGVLDDIRKCVNLQRPGRIPVFANSEEFDVRMSGITYEDYCRDAEKMARTQIMVVEKYDYDWSWLQVDDCMEFEVLGVGVKGEGNILRATCNYLPADYKTLHGLSMPDPKTAGRMPVLLGALSKVKAHFRDTVCVVGRAAAPFSCVGLLYGMEELMTLPYSDPKLLRETMEFFVELQIKFGLAQFQAGADAIWLGDCNASSHLLSPQLYRKFALEPARRVIEAYKKAGGLVFYHASEEGKSLPIMTDLGTSALTSGPGMDIKDALKMTAGKVCYLGNLDPIRILQNGTSAQVEAETIRIMTEGKKVNGFLFGTGEMVPRETPEENMMTMIRTAKKYGQF
jgi:uroporphyrinogen decarboxylase